jgi:glycerol-3-phosphate dehydrogenase
MIGGKLASYRIFAQELSDVVAARTSSRRRPAPRTTRPLPGGERVPDAIPLAERYARHAGRGTSARLSPRFHRGARARAQRRRPAERDVTCPCEPVLEAEVRHVVREEMARTVEDVARRTRLGLGACGGMRCAARCGQIVAEERGLPPREGLTMAREFLVRQGRSRIVAMGPEQARQEALALAHMRASMGET